MGSVGALSRLFMHGLNTVEVTNLNVLLNALDERKAPGGKQRGLLTVCNHVGVYVNHFSGVTENTYAGM
jgi:monolysocardiolipin acyltransferase